MKKKTKNIVDRLWEAQDQALIALNEEDNYERLSDLRYELLDIRSALFEILRNANRVAVMKDTDCNIKNMETKMLKARENALNYIQEAIRFNHETKEYSCE